MCISENSPWARSTLRTHHIPVPWQPRCREKRSSHYLPLCTDLQTRTMDQLARHLTVHHTQGSGTQTREHRSAKSRAFPALAVHHPRGDPVGFPPRQRVRAHGLLVQILAALAWVCVSQRHEFCAGTAPPRVVATAQPEGTANIYMLFTVWMKT